MANEKRLIDANALIERLKFKRTISEVGLHRGLQSAMSQVEKAHTVDAVEVVRCKDCKHYEWDEFDGCHVCIRLSKYVKEDFFCSYGERR